MDAQGVERTLNTYNLMIKYYTEGRNIEAALRWLNEMGDHGYVPTVKVMQSLIKRVARRGHARLALDLAEAYEHTSGREVDSETWSAVLASCAETLFVSVSAEHRTACC